MSSLVYGHTKFLSGRFWLIILAFDAFQAPTEGELSTLGHSLLWHQTHVQGNPCPDCKLVFTVRNTLMEIVQVINAITYILSIEIKI